RNLQRHPYYTERREHHRQGDGDHCSVFEEEWNGHDHLVWNRSSIQRASNSDAKRSRIHRGGVAVSIFTSGVEIPKVRVSGVDAQRVMLGTGSEAVEVWPGYKDVAMDFNFN